MPSAITITFGDVAENGPGMEKLGTLAPRGLSFEELCRAKALFELRGFQCDLVFLVSAGEAEMLGDPEVGPEPAYVLIVRNGAAAFFGGDGSSPPAPPTAEAANALLAEQEPLVPDKKAIIRDEVKNKLARWNLTFGEEAQEPCYEEGKGRIVPYASVPRLGAIRAGLPKFFGPLTRALRAEGNYYDTAKCGIGYHGDGERRVVIAFRFGALIPLVFRWFVGWKPAGAPVRLELRLGDMYAMSAKAVGRDWKSPSFPTLRHAAGAAKYTEYTEIQG